MGLLDWFRKPIPYSKKLSEPLVAVNQVLSESPLITVIMTTYNGAEWIERAIASLQKQTFCNIEIIVVDDASRDLTPEIVRRLANEDGRIRMIHLDENVGTYRAKNVAIQQARGDVITFMDSDDYCEPTRLEKQLELLRDPALVVTTCNYVRKTSDGVIVLNRGLEQRQALISVMFKRNVLSDVGGFDPVRISADDEFFERIRLVYGRAAHRNVAEPLYVARHRETSLSRDKSSGVRLDSASSQDALSPARAAYQKSYQEWHMFLTSKNRRPFISMKRTNARPFKIELEINKRPAID